MALVPVIGRTVIYILTVQDAAAINACNGKHNLAHEGDAFPAVMVRVWPPYQGPEVVNLQVFYDGDGSYWATSRPEGERPGSWHWPMQVA